MASKSKPQRGAKKTSDKPVSGGAELPATGFWRRVLMIGALIAIAAGVAETVTGAFGIVDRAASWFESPVVTPMAFPQEGPDESLIIVAEFDRSSGIPDSRAHERIADALRGTIASMNLENVRVETLPEAIPIRASDRVEEIGKLYGATTVIWGEETSVDVRVNLRNRREVWNSRLFRSGEGGIQVSASTHYLQPEDFDVVTPADFSAPRGGIPYDPWLPLVFSPLLIAPEDMDLVKTEGAYITTNADPQQYINLITTDLPNEIAFFALLPLAEVQMFNGNEQVALDLLEQGLAARGNSHSSDDDIGEVYREVARLHLSIARQHEEAMQQGWQNIALDHARSAETRLNQALAAGLTEPLTYYFLGLASYQMRQYIQAVQHFDTAMDLMPDDHLRVFVLHNRSMAKMDLSDYQGALDDIALELMLDPNASGAYGNRIRTLSRLGDHLGVINEFDKLAKLVGSEVPSPDLVVMKGQAYIALKQYDKAVETYETLAAAIGPENRAYVEERLNEAKALAVP